MPRSDTSDILHSKSSFCLRVPPSKAALVKRTAPRRPPQGCGITMKQKKSKRRSELPEYQMSISALRSRPLPAAAPLSLSLSLSVSRSPNSTSSLILPPPLFTCVHTLHTGRIKGALAHLFKGADAQGSAGLEQSNSSIKLTYLSSSLEMLFLIHPFSEGQWRCL